MCEKNFNIKILGYLRAILLKEIIIKILKNKKDLRIKTLIIKINRWVKTYRENCFVCLKKMDRMNKISKKRILKIKMK